MTSRRSATARAAAIRLATILMVSTLMAGRPAMADDATHQAAQELVDLVNATTLDDMVSSLSTAMWPSIRAAMPKTIDEATLADIKAEFDRITRKYVGEAMKVAPDIYARHFTTEELRGLLAFYKSPLGQKTLTETPKLMADLGSTAMGPMMAPMQAELKDSLGGVLRKHGVAQ